MNVGDGGAKEYKSVEQVREDVVGETKYVKDPLRRACVKVLLRVEPAQLTIEMAVRALRAGEAYYRECAEQALAERGGEDTIDYNIWSKFYDALQGAEGKGSVSKTIDFFREDAAFLRRMSAENRKTIGAGGPFEGNPFLVVANKQEQIKVWERMAGSDDHVARLFQKQQPRFVVAGE